MESKKAILMNEKDNVATLLVEVEPGQPVRIEAGGQNYTLQANDHIPYGHKIAIKDIDNAGEVIKYGEVIGRSTDHIQQGCHVHVHNLESLSLGDL